MAEGFADLRQARASSGMRIDTPVALADVLAVVDRCDRWELRWINQVWWEGKDSAWVDQSWDEPLVLDDQTLRAQAAAAEQVINGRFTGFDQGSEVVMIEAVDSSFWLVCQCAIGAASNRVPPARLTSRVVPFQRRSRLGRGRMGAAMTECPPVRTK
jgi:hypothetical protein